MTRLGPGVLALALATAAVGAPACAADLPPAPTSYPPVYRPALYNWTGFYFGGHVGGGLLADSISQVPGTPLATLTGPINLGPFSVVGGGQTGVNYEFAPWVIGFEGTVSSSNISGTGNVVSSLGGENFTSAPKWLYSAAGRAGYAADTLWFYLKGGGAWMRVDYSQQVTGAAATPLQFITDTRNGYVVGAGLEYGMTENFSAKFEYDFYGFGSKTYNFVQTPVSVKSDVHVVTVGINYRLNWSGGGPLVPARY
jgi:outer membrane immunogenic protein